MWHLFFPQLFLSLLCFCLLFPSTSFLVMDMIPYVIFGICSTSIYANFMFCCCDHHFCYHSLCTGNPSLHSGAEVIILLGLLKTSLFIVQKMWMQDNGRHHFMMWTRFISYVHHGTFSTQLKSCKYGYVKRVICCDFIT